MTKQTEVILKEIENINQEILILCQRVNRLEENFLQEQIKIVPKNNIDVDNLDKILESATTAMNRFNKRINRES